MPKFNEDEFNKEIFDEHNKFRNLHGAPSLEQDPELYQLSKKIVSEMCEKNKFTTIENNKKIGQLTISLEGQEPNAVTIMNEIKNGAQNYDYSSNECPESNRYFAQIVWVDSKKFGSAIKSNKDGKNYIVFLYKPPGNVVGQYIYNVFPKGTPLMKRNLKTMPSLDHIPSEEEIRTKMILIHNKVRQSHSSPKIEWDELIEKFAKEHAKKLLEEKNNDKVFSNSPQKYGRCTIISTGIIPSVETCCKKWYDSSEKYDYYLNKFQPDSSCFCQMVWHDSERMGAAYAFEGNTCVVVALYSPTGNTLGGYNRNVSRLTGSPPTIEEIS